MTQLKWRLLEGGGEAYYELGVADNGALVGLPRAELDQSLETLEMMAGEIGASVIVVRKVEVPVAVAGSAASETDYWNGKRRLRKPIYHSDTTGVEVESDAQTIIDAILDVSQDSSPSSIRLAAHSEPNSESTHQSPNNPTPPVFPLEFEIPPVFVPLGVPGHHHTTFSVDQLGVTTFACTQSGTEYRAHPISTNNTHTPSLPHRQNVPLRHELTGSPVVQTKQEAKWLSRNQARDRKRAAKLLPTPEAPVHVSESTSYPSPDAQSLPLRVSADSPVDQCQTASASVTPLDSIPVLKSDVSLAIPPVSNMPSPGRLTSTEPRLVVEALVVRKMSLEEAFLDFSGFSLT